MNHHPEKTRRHDKHLTEAHTSPTKTRTIIGIGVLLEITPAASVGYLLATNPFPLPQLVAVILALALLSVLGALLQHRPLSPRPTTQSVLDRLEQVAYDMGFLICTAGASAILSTKASNWWAAGPLTLVAVAAAAALFRILKGAASSSAQDLRTLASQHREEARRLEARATELDPPQTSTP